MSYSVPQSWAATSMTRMTCRRVVWSASSGTLQLRPTVPSPSRDRLPHMSWPRSISKSFFMLWSSTTILLEEVVSV